MSNEAEISKINIASFVVANSQESVFTHGFVIPPVEREHGRKMADKVLDADYIRNLLAGDKKKAISKEPPKVQFATAYKSDPIKLPQAGYPVQGDRGDIWAQWVKQGRTGAAELIERWGA